MRKRRSYARPRLVDAQDMHYRAFLQEYLIRRRNQRPSRPPSQREIFGGQVEQILRTWLANQLTLSERRILEYEERIGTRVHRKYRELDAVVLGDDRSVWVFEIKASRLPGRLHRAVRQLSETRAILRSIFPLVHATILLVDTSVPVTTEEMSDDVEECGPADEQAPTPPSIFETSEMLHQISSLDERSRDGVLIDVCCFSVDDIVALAGDMPLALDWAADDAGEEPLPRPLTSIAYSSDDDSTADEAADGDIADALRRAGWSQ